MSQETPHVLISLAESPAGYEGLLLQILLSETRPLLPGLTSATSCTEEHTLDLLGQGIPDVVLLSAPFATGNGLSKLDNLRRFAPDVPVVAVCESGVQDLTRRILQHGAQDCLVKEELSSSLLGRSLRYAIEIQHHRNALRRLERYDAVTGLLTGQSLLRILGRLLERRQKQPQMAFGVLVVEIGDLYLVIRRHGRAFGDRLLGCIARRLEQAARAGDLIARLAGGDFALVLHSIHSFDEVRAVAERVRVLMGEPLPLQRQVELTVRSGLALSGQPYDGAHDMVGAAVLRLKCS